LFACAVALLYYELLTSSKKKALITGTIRSLFGISAIDLGVGVRFGSVFIFARGVSSSMGSSTTSSTLRLS
jgi:hypothetical protein